MQHLTLTPDLIEKISEFVENGAAFRDCYLLAGVSNHTGSNWRRQALEDKKAGTKEEDSLYIQLMNRMDEAKARYYQSLVNCVRAAGKRPEHWTAAMTLLERTNPEVYGKFTRVKKYADLGLDPQTQTPLELVCGLVKAVIEGKISTHEGKQISEILGNLLKTEENTKGWAIINELKEALKKDKS